MLGEGHSRAVEALREWRLTALCFDQRGYLWLDAATCPEDQAIGLDSYWLTDKSSNCYECLIRYGSLK